MPLVSDAYLYVVLSLGVLPLVFATGSVDLASPRPERLTRILRIQRPASPTLLHPSRCRRMASGCLLRCCISRRPALGLRRRDSLRRIILTGAQEDCVRASVGGTFPVPSASVLRPVCPVASAPAAV
ncbi:hypothetical protein BD309DRAFT_947721 [Dichomitus squalens]|nr:hypothetical protein BD309DRAFT_947721 [Dichomitus squalens]